MARHYDLGNDLYELFLDADMQYSCAYFEHPGQDLESAQLAKKRHIAAKLLIDPYANARVSSAAMRTRHGSRANISRAPPPRGMRTIPAFAAESPT